MLAFARRNTRLEPALAADAAKALLLFCRECPRLARQLGSHVGHANQLYLPPVSESAAPSE